MHRRLRLRHQSDFQQLRQQGLVKRHPCITITYLANVQDHNHYGFITPKRLGNAVQRNKVRRQMKEAVRLLHPQLQQGYNVLFIARDALVGQPFHAIQRILNDLCERAGLKQQGADS